MMDMKNLRVKLVIESRAVVIVDKNSTLKVHSIEIASDGVFIVQGKLICEYGIKKLP